jgi:hypothetical protein
MINQIAPVKTQTQSLGGINKGLIQARHIQSRLKSDSLQPMPFEDGSFANHMTSGPFLVPTHFWFD